jgi:hypothetical protein
MAYPSGTKVLVRVPENAPNLWKVAKVVSYSAPAGYTYIRIGFDNPYLVPTSSISVIPKESFKYKGIIFIWDDSLGAWEGPSKCFVFVGTQGIQVYTKHSKSSETKKFSGKNLHKVIDQALKWSKSLPTPTPTHPIWEVLQEMTGVRPPCFVKGFTLSTLSDKEFLELQDWAATHVMPSWLTGVGLLEAAERQVQLAVANGNISDKKEQT